MKKTLYIKRKSQKQEKKTAELFGGKVQIASGALDGMKGDVRTGACTPSFNENDFLIENKFTDADNYKLQVSIWKKIAKEALRDNLRTPMLQVDIQNVSLVILAKEVMDMYITWEPSHTQYIDKAKSTTLKKLNILQEISEAPYYYRTVEFGAENLILGIVQMDDFRNSY